MKLTVHRRDSSSRNYSDVLHRLADQDREVGSAASNKH